MTTYCSQDARLVPTEAGAVVLAHGEVTGHTHRIETTLEGAAPQLFEEPDGRRVLLAVEPCVLRHPEHDPIPLDPEHPVMARQGDVLLVPLGPGTWEVVRQREYVAGAIRRVQD